MTFACAVLTINALVQLSALGLQVPEQRTPAFYGLCAFFVALDVGAIAVLVLR